MPFGQDRWSILTDGQLDARLRDILEISPRAGQVMIMGMLRHQGVILQRQRVREAIHRVNPIAVALRRRYSIRRRRYNVGCPNALWYVLLVPDLLLL